MDIKSVASTEFISGWFSDRKSLSIPDFLLNWSKGKVKKIYMGLDNYFVTPKEQGRYTEDRHEHIDVAINDDDYMAEITTLGGYGFSCDICNADFGSYYMEDDYSPSYTYMEQDLITPIKGPINKYLCEACNKKVFDRMSEAERLSFKPIKDTEPTEPTEPYRRNELKECCSCGDDNIAYVYQEIDNYDLCPKCYNDISPKGFVLVHGSIPPKKQYPYGSDIETLDSCDSTYYKIYYEYTSPDGNNYEYIIHYMNSCCSARDLLMSPLTVDECMELLSAAVEWKKPKLIKPELTWQKLCDIWWDD